VWPMLSALAPRSSSIKVRDGVISLGSSLHVEGKIILELSGKSTLGRDGALKMAQILSESSTPSMLTALDFRQETVESIYISGSRLSLSRYGWISEMNAIFDASPSFKRAL
jgi:hypothetical protein